MSKPGREDNQEKAAQEADRNWQLGRKFETLLKDNTAQGELLKFLKVGPLGSSYIKDIAKGDGFRLPGKKPKRLGMITELVKSLGVEPSEKEGVTAKKDRNFSDEGIQIWFSNVFFIKSSKGSTSLFQDLIDFEPKHNKKEELQERSAFVEATYIATLKFICGKLGCSTTELVSLFAKSYPGQYDITEAVKLYEEEQKEAQSAFTGEPVVKFHTGEDSTHTSGGLLSRLTGKESKELSSDPKIKKIQKDLGGKLKESIWGGIKSCSKNENAACRAIATDVKDVLGDDIFTKDDSAILETYEKDHANSATIADLLNNNLFGSTSYLTKLSQGVLTKYGPLLTSLDDLSRNALSDNARAGAQKEHRELLTKVEERQKLPIKGMRVAVILHLCDQFECTPDQFKEAYEGLGNGVIGDDVMTECNRRQQKASSSPVIHFTASALLEQVAQKEKGGK